MHDSFGRVGKSAVATLFVHHLVQHGHRVLAIDLDHQGNFGTPVQRSNRAAAAGLTADRLLTETVSVIPSVAFVLVPSDRVLLMLERQPTMHTPFARNLRSFFTTMDAHFDVCVIDKSEDAFRDRTIDNLRS